VSAVEYIIVNVHVKGLTGSGSVWSASQHSGTVRLSSWAKSFIPRSGMRKRRTSAIRALFTAVCSKITR